MVVDKLNNVWNISQTEIENIVIFSYANKIAIFDLEKRDIIKEIKIRNCYYLEIISCGNFVGINADYPCLLDLKKMEIVKKFNNCNIIGKYLIDPNNIAEQSWQPYTGRIVDLFSDKLLFIASYHTDSPKRTSFDWHSYLCTYDIQTGKMLGYEKMKDVDPLKGIGYIRKEPKYLFVEDNEETINAMLSSIKIKKEKNFKPLFYNKKYNVLFFRNGDHCYSYYVDSCNETNDEVVIPENDLFNKPGFDEQDYIRKNGLTDEVLNYFSDEVILDGGYFWALESIEQKEQETNLSFEELLNKNKITDEELILFSVGLFETFLEDDGIDQYFSSEENEGVEYLIKALQLVEAKETAKVIKKGAKIQADKSNKDKCEEFIKLEEELDEDYVGMAIQYIKKSKLQS